MSFKQKKWWDRLPVILTPLHGASITYRIPLSLQQGRKVFTIQTFPACEDNLLSTVGQEEGFSLCAGVAVRTHERDMVERLCRCVSLSQGRNEYWNLLEVQRW